MLKSYAQSQPWNDKIELRIWQELMYNGQPQAAFAEPPIFRTLDRTQSVEFAPTLQLTYDDAQRLMNTLWDCGIRPAAGIGSVGQLAATEKHLLDMRTMAFKLMALEPPK